MRNRKHIRLNGFDYSSMRYYFVTMKVKDHIRSFGSIIDKSMHLSGNGVIAMEQWHWLGDRYPYIDLLSFVIMPDHIHGIIHINPNYFIDNDESGFDNNDEIGFDNNVGKGRDPSLLRNNNIDNNKFNDNTDQNVPIRKPNKIKPLTELIGAYKTTVSKRIHMAGDMEFKWQNSYHDHIIRKMRSLNRIKHYIETNPENWDLTD